MLMQGRAPVPPRPVRVPPQQRHAARNAVAQNLARNVVTTRRGGSYKVIVSGKPGTVGQWKCDRIMSGYNCHAGVSAIHHFWVYCWLRRALL